MLSVPLIGLCGDALTFVGGLLLALDTAQKGREFKAIQALKNPQLARLEVEVDGVVVVAGDSAERIFVHRSARRAVVGCWILSGGFLLLLAARIGEIISLVK